MTKTKSTVLELPPMDHQALQYVAQVTSRPQKVVAVEIFQRGLAVLTASPTFQEKVHVHEEARSTALARLGLTHTAELGVEISPTLQQGFPAAPNEE
ncbi:MAG TPA: hypothetical protein EYF98_11805 [Planctomycetes bacterium]|nr:hypothetical protein [Planctomycetota bacterium]